MTFRTRERSILEPFAPERFEHKHRIRFTSEPVTSGCFIVEHFAPQHFAQGHFRQERRIPRRSTLACFISERFIPEVFALGHFDISLYSACVRCPGAFHPREFASRHRCKLPRDVPNPFDIVGNIIGWASEAVKMAS